MAAENGSVNEPIKVKIKLHEDFMIGVEAGTSLSNLAKQQQDEFRSRIVAARVDNDIRELTYEIKMDCSVAFIDQTDDDGLRIYRRSLRFLLIKAVHDLFCNRKVVINHSISKGIYIEIKGDLPLTADDVAAIEKRMHELTGEAIPFERIVIPLEEAKERIKKSGRDDMYHVLEVRTKSYFTIYRCGDIEDYFYGYMVPDTSYLDLFSLKFYAPGLIMLYPEKSNPGVLPEFKEQKKLFAIFNEYKNWGQILGFENIGNINDAIRTDNILQLILVAEGLQEKKIVQIADNIVKEPGLKKFILISGPSSSGKTTFAERLSVQLRVNGIKPFNLSIDNFFLDREKTPVDENGEFDYESVDAIDVNLFNRTLEELLAGRETEIPIYNFVQGKREEHGRVVKLYSNQVVVIEGIHGLNRGLTASIPDEYKYRIYVSALTSMNIDDHNRVPTTDTRLIRRIVRDYNFRGSDALSTLRRWPSVRRGEETYIFPYQESADIMFNSALIYELGVLKIYAQPLLEQIPNIVPEYSEAKRLIEFLSYFLPVRSVELPLNSIIREFVGGSCLI